MPVQIGFYMHAEKPVLLPSFTGYLAHDLVLPVIRQIFDLNGSGLLQELGVSEPYSITTLQFKSRRRVENGCELDPVFPCHAYFRFLKDNCVTFDLDYSQNCFADYFQKQSSLVKPDKLMIFDVVFHLLGLGVHFKRYADFEREAQMVDRFRLLFRSPTFLARTGSAYRRIFPDAVKVFTSLMHVWNLFSDSRQFSGKECIAYKDWLGKNVSIPEYELRTQLTVARKKKVTGFVGWVTYEMKDKESEWNRVTDMLARYAEYANIGENKTEGYGETRYIPLFNAEQEDRD